MRGAPERFDFVRQTGSVEGFERRFGRPARRLLDGLSAKGCVVTRDATFGHFVRAFADRPAALTLVAHWDERDRIEFADGLRAWQDVAGVVPDAYDGVLDLCVCRPDPLVRSLNARVSGLVRTVPRVVSHPIAWLGLYLVMATMLAQRDALFEDVLLEGVQEIGGLSKGERHARQ